MNEDFLDFYNKMQPLIQNEIKNAIDKYASENQYTFSLIPAHGHTGTDSPKIDPSNLLGFPIMTVAPTDSAQNGIIRLALIGGTYYLYARINNLWKRVALT